MDNDGIIDTVDSCPTQKETNNGYQDSDGCPDEIPEKDTDGDGINDVDDSCPTQKETNNGYQDSDGCPDKELIIDGSGELEIPAPFVDESKDPQSYVDRYNNESSYKEWFDDNFPEYDSIYEAVGLEGPIGDNESKQECEPGTELVNGVCKVIKNDEKNLASGNSNYSWIVLRNSRCGHSWWSRFCGI